MKKFIIIADKRKFLVVANNEVIASITFSKNYPSLKVKDITETFEDVFNIIE